MFFDIFTMLCEEKGVSRYVAATAIGKNRSAVARWKSGSIPNGSTLSLLAEYFGVTSDYLLGATNDAQRKLSEYRLKKLETAYSAETDNDARFSIACEIDALRESILDLKYAEVANEQKRNATVESDESEYLEQLRNSPNTRALLHTIRYMNEEQIGAYAHFAEQIRKGGWNGKED